MKAQIVHVHTHLPKRLSFSKLLYEIAEFFAINTIRVYHELIKAEVLRYRNAACKRLTIQVAHVILQWPFLTTPCVLLYRPLCEHHFIHIYNVIFLLSHLRNIFYPLPNFLLSSLNLTLFNILVFFTFFRVMSCSRNRRRIILGVIDLT